MLKKIEECGEQIQREPAFAEPGYASRSDYSGRSLSVFPPALMDAKQEILDIPRALQEVLEKGCPDYESLVRKTRWGDGPIFVVGTGTSFLVGLTAVCAFERLLGWPVVVRPTLAFAAYGLGVLRPRSILVVISISGEADETLDLVRAARSRGAVVLALTSNPASPLAQTTDGVFIVRDGGEPGAGVKALVLGQAAISLIGLVAAKALKRHHPQLDLLEQEFEKLPQHMEWVLSQLADAVRSFASELRRLRRLPMVGAGFYHPLALQGAFLMRKLGGLEAQGFELSEFCHGALPQLDRAAAVAFLSGSHCRLKKEVYQAAAQVRSAGGKIVSVTDTNDRELADRSMLVLLLPTLTEMVGSTLTLTLLAWVAYWIAGEQGRDPSRWGGSRGTSPVSGDLSIG